MTKDIFLTLKSIKYSGKSIGDDIRIEIEANGKTFEKNFTIEKGETRNLEEQIGIFRIDQNTFNIPISVKIIERDKVLNDVGIKKESLKVDFNKFRIQKKSVSVQVKESRWLIVNPEAHFDVGFDVQVMDVMHYVEEQEGGFLNVKIDGYKDIQSLPAFLKVRFDHHEGGRDYFTVMEGWRQGKTGSVKLKDNGKSFLIYGNPHTTPIYMEYSRSEKKLKIKRKSYQAIEHPGEPWKNGFYDIEIADYPHKGGIQYLDQAPRAKIWFHIGHERRKGKDEEKFIHTGQGTLGCITITEPNRWDEIYELFIRARLGDFKSIGILEVTD